MSTSHDPTVTDDVVAALLLRDAKRRSESSYQLLPGEPSAASTRRRNDLPKPNTRFLKNILRDTDQHNAVLKRREEAESRARLDALTHPVSAGPRAARSGGRTRDLAPERKDRWTQALAGLGVDASKTSSRRKERHAETQRTGRRRGRDDARSSHRDRSRSPIRDSKSRACSRSPRQSHDSRVRQRSPPLSRENNTSNGPVRTRGRGAQGSSKFDERFQADYNPRHDVDRDESELGDDDWGNALEALRDRERWRQIGAERLKDAGFSESEVKRWEKGDSKDVEDVKWRSKEEEREWDRGKTVGDDGVIDLKASWVRGQED